jgi:hypothetical protein
MDSSSFKPIGITSIKQDAMTHRIFTAATKPPTTYIVANAHSDTFYSSQSTLDPITGKVFLAGSVYAFTPKDFIIDSTNKRIYSIDIPESLTAGIPKFYGSWQPKDENGDVITETPYGITTDATYLYISFSDGKIRKYTKAGVIQTIVSGVYYRDFGKVFNTLGKNISGVSENISYDINLVGNSIATKSFTLWNSRNEAYPQTLLADTSANKILLSSGKISIYDSSNLIQQWQDWDNTDNISTADYISSGLIVGKADTGLVKKLSLSFGYHLQNTGQGMYSDQTLIPWGVFGYNSVFGGSKISKMYLLYNPLSQNEIDNAEFFCTVYSNSYPAGAMPIGVPTIASVDIYSQDFYPLNWSKWSGGTLIKSYASGLVFSFPAIFELPLNILSSITDMQFRFEYPAGVSGYYFSDFIGGAFHPIYVREKASTVNSFQLDTNITWKDFTLR